MSRPFERPLHSAWGSRLRFRLAVGYVAFVGVVLAAVGFFFWHYVKQQAEVGVMMAVDADWGATVGFLRFENQRPSWVYDRNDPDEAFTVARLRHIYLLADEHGSVLESSSVYASIGIDTPQTRSTIERILHKVNRDPEFFIKRDENRIPYLVRAGFARDSENHKYFLAIGRSLAGPYRTADVFIRSYWILASVLLAMTGIFGWWLAGIATPTD